MLAPLAAPHLHTRPATRRWSNKFVLDRAAASVDTKSISKEHMVRAGSADALKVQMVQSGSGPTVQHTASAPILQGVMGTSWSSNFGSVEPDAHESYHTSGTDIAEQDLSDDQLGRWEDSAEQDEHRSGVVSSVHASFPIRSCRVSALETFPDEDAAEPEQEMERPLILARLKRSPSMSMQVMIENRSSIDGSYKVAESTIGKGSYGAVRTATVKATKAVRAVKSVFKASVKETILKQEVEILKLVDHPNVVKLYEVFEDRDYLHLVFELCSGGSFRDYVRSWGPLKEGIAVKVMTQLMQAVSYLHSRHIVHRDVKPANCLLVEPSIGQVESNSRLKLCDFGFSCVIRPGQMLKARVGTAAFVAPEVLRRQYDERCDVWSSGITMYSIICGYGPFRGKTEENIRKKVAVGRIQFNSADWLEVSEAGMRMVKIMTVTDASARLGAMQVLQDEWFITNKKLSETAGVLLEPTLLKNLQGFRSLNKFKRAALQVIVSLLDEDQTRQSREAFIWLDENGDGVLSITEVKEKLKHVASTQEVDAMFRSLGQDNKDTDPSLLVFTYTEFLAATFDRSAFCHRNVCRAAFNIMDTDGNGSISSQELRDGQVLGSLSPEEAEALVSMFDGNKDGAIDFDEFCHLMQDNEGWTAAPGALRPSRAKLRRSASYCSTDSCKESASATSSTRDSTPRRSAVSKPPMARAPSATSSTFDSTSGRSTMSKPPMARAPSATSSTFDSTSRRSTKSKPPMARAPSATSSTFDPTSRRSTSRLRMARAPSATSSTFDSSDGRPPFAERQSGSPEKPAHKPKTDRAPLASRLVQMRGPVSR
jgi:calcium-dependent protein kinase